MNTLNITLQGKYLQSYAHIESAKAGFSFILFCCDLKYCQSKFSRIPISFLRLIHLKSRRQRALQQELHVNWRFRQIMLQVWDASLWSEWLQDVNGVFGGTLESGSRKSGSDIRSRFVRNILVVAPAKVNLICLRVSDAKWW